MMDPSLALFLIEAGVRLGRKLQEVLVDETAQRPLLMPLGDLFGSVTEAEAMRFFAVEQADLIRPGGACHAIRNDRERLIQVYRAMRGLEAQDGIGMGDAAAARRSIVDQLAALDQFDQKYQARHPARRILGTVVEVGIDYFAAHPESMGRDSTARKIVHAFVEGLQDTDFAEGKGRQILGDLLGASLRAVGNQASLLDDDRRLTVLLGGVTRAVADDLRNAVADENELSRQQLFRRVGSSLLRGAASAFSQDIAVFLPDDGAAREIVADTLTQVLAGIAGQEDLFTNETLECVVRSALRATAENQGLLTDHKMLQTLIGRTTTVLADRQWDKLFSAATGGAILHEVLEVTRENIETLMRPDRPQEALLARALAAMAGSLSAKLAGGGSIQDLLSRRQVVDLARTVLMETARNPELLVGRDEGDPRRTVLAQVVASVAKALGEDPSMITTGEGFLRLTRAALQITLQNADALVDTQSLTPGTNLLYKVLHALVSTLTAQPDLGHLIRRDVLLDVVERVLPVIGANIEVLHSRPKLVAETMASVLDLVRGSLVSRINGANLAPLTAHILAQVLWDELDVEDETKLVAAAREFLRTVSH